MKKRVMTIAITSVMMCIVMLTKQSNKMIVQAEEINKTAMQQYVEAMQPGWNLGNTFEAAGQETSWGNPTTTKEIIDSIAAAGFKSIRIPVRWDQRIGSAPDFTIKPEFLTRLKQVIDWSLDAGLYVMINMHHEEWVMKMETQHDTVKSRYDAAWTQIATYFKDYPNTLMFESINEPRFSDDWNKDMPIYFNMLEELNKSFHTIVRNSGGNNATRPLVLPTITCSTSQERLNELYNTITELNDENIIATVHYYGYWPFSVNIAGTTTFDHNVKNDVISTFDRVYNTFVSKGIPVILGEYGLLGFDSSLGTIQHGEILKYFEYVTYYAKTKGITHMLWDNGQHYNRRQLKWGDVDLYHVIISSINSRSSNSVNDSVYLKKGESITDQLVKLNLNGNTLVNIKHGDETLTNGTEYLLNNDTLTLKSTLLESLVTEQFGKNATLTLEFSAGANWKIHINYYDTPILRSTTGYTSSFMIPTVFNGDRLATMHATYKTGGNAGPQNWTPYKEFDRAFKPNYSTNSIQLTTDFFKEVRDGEVILKMYFWSGEIVEYHMTKAGTSITGVSTNEPVELPEEPQEPNEPNEPETTTNPEGPNENETPNIEPNRISPIFYIIAGVFVSLSAASTWFIFKKRG